MEKNARLEERITEKHVKTFLDIVVLAMLNGEPLYGYKIIATIHRKFGILLSPGSLYPVLHTLEDNKLIESNFQGGKIVYLVTPKGEQRFQNTFFAYKVATQKVSNFMKAHGKTFP